MAEPPDTAAPHRAQTAAYGPPEPRDSALGDTYATRYGRRPAVRGGHPEHREPGGGWGADSSGFGPDGEAPAHGRVLQGMPGGGVVGGGHSWGPRQDYIEVFDDAVFGKAPRAASDTSAGASQRGGAVRAPAPRHPDGGPGVVPGAVPAAGGGAGRVVGIDGEREAGPDPASPPGRSLPDPGPAPLRGPRGRRPPAQGAAQGQWHASGGAGSAAFPQATRESGPMDADGEPRRLGEREPGADGADRRDGPRTAHDGLPAAPPPRMPAQDDGAGARGGGPVGRAFTGVLAVAVVTVLAFVVAGQITSGVQDGADDGGGAGVGAERGLSADDPASRSDKGRGTPDDAQGAAPSYAEKMGATFPLKSEFKGEGDFAAVPGKDAGAGGSEVMRYRVDVEKGLPLESELFAQAVQKTLNDKRSWARGGERSFDRVSKGDVDFVITLASSPTTDEWCAKSGLDTSEQNVSCDSASTDRIMINAYRWAQGSKTFGDERIFGYRQMLINHEVGHRIGYDHVGCPKDGALAPVMMQQTKSLTSEGRKCRPNPWPSPDA